MSTTAPPPPRLAPTTAAERSPAPDLARGAALLAIALANSPLHLTDRDLGPSGRPVDGSGADRVADVVVGLLADNRAFPMFTLLLAYGLAVLARRLRERGTPWPQARWVLLRRTLVLGLVGLAHLLLLFEGDVLLAYGVLGVALVLLVLRAKESTLRVLAVVGLLPFLLFGGLDGLSVGAEPPLGDLVPSTYLGAALLRGVTAFFTVLGAPVVVLVLLTPAVLGVLLERRQVLQRPSEHVPALRRLTVGGFAIGLLGGLPLVLASVQVIQVGAVADFLLAVLHAGTGLAQAVAAAALAGWVVAVRERRAGGTWVPTGAWAALTAVGQRSLTCYLLQSVVMVPLLAPWGLGLGVGAGTAFVALVGVGTYLFTVAVALGLQRAGRRGPAEVMLRRLVYGRPG
ncbi:DUF418 domain-containing protein [Pseudokineococcus sp. 1T1Z-3]|uniref:DUF418 domain-containing protein n=1 Tax=Pseudokineococcus sp. 1T1Z-3 TaxID=3132745 RepID=UPI003096A3AE